MIKKFKDLGITLLIIILSFGVLFFFFKNISSNKKYDRVATALTQANFKNQEFEKTVNELKQEVSEQSQLILSKDEAISSGLLEIKGLKKVKSKVTFATKTKIRQITTELKPVENKLSKNTSILDSVNTVSKLKSFKIIEPDGWYTIKGVVSKELLKINELIINNKYEIVIADKRMGFFSKNKPIVELTNFNPYTQTIEMSNVIIKYDKPFYKKGWFWLVIGATSGFILAK